MDTKKQNNCSCAKRFQYNSPDAMQISFSSYFISIIVKIFISHLTFTSIDGLGKCAFSRSFVNLVYKILQLCIAYRNLCHMSNRAYVTNN